MTNFYNKLCEIDDIVNNTLDVNTPMNPMNDDEIQQFEEAVVCFLCKQPFDIKTRHHNHVTGNFIAPCCNRCNLQLKPKKFKARGWNKKRKVLSEEADSYMEEIPGEKVPISSDDKDDGKKEEEPRFFIPVIFHNGKNYDMHHILKFLQNNSLSEVRDFRVIATNSEKFISVQIGNLRILDSCQFLPGSLESLVDNLKSDGEKKFVHTRRKFRDPVERSLILRKGVYPYEYMSSSDKFLDNQLPPIECFESKLNDSQCSGEDYEHAQSVWKTFGIKTMQQYHDLYLLSDVLLLADVFENFRKFSLSNYDLDPAHYYTSPGLSFDACLKMTGVKIELLMDIDALLFFESAIRGGVSMITHREAKANNPEVPDYKLHELNSYIQYYDANNLYGWAMSQPLPTGDFKFLELEDFYNIDFARIPDDAKTGFMLEVDLHYPPELHDLHNDLPLAPQRKTIPDSFLSPYQHELHTKFGTKQNPRIEKLVPNFLSKFRYVLHYRNLKYYLQQGLILGKVHRVMSFTQSPWIKPYIDFNTAKRQEAKSSSDKNFFKFLNNALFGKTMQNLRNQTDIRLTISGNAARNYASKPNYQSFQNINETLVAIKMKQVRIFWDKPTFTGACILDLSKLHLYKFHYDVMKAMYGNDAQLLFTDTDSLCYHIETGDLYDDMKKEWVCHMDTANFPKSHPCYSIQNDRKLGFMKDECEGVQPHAFVGLRAKMYSLKLSKGAKSTAKGLKNSFQKKHLNHETFEDSLNNKTKTTAEFVVLRSKNHTIRTLVVKKDGLNPFDDKRYILPDGKTTLSYGHYKIPKIPKSTGVL